MSMSGGGAGRRGLAWGEIAIGLSVIALAAVVWWQTGLIPVSPIYAKVGPTVMPTLAAVGLGALGLLLLAAGVRGGWQTPDEKSIPPDRAALGWVIGGLGLNVALIGTAGFTIASTLLFLCVARGFGSRRILRDAAIGFVFALVAYLGFARTLGIDIGSGLVERGVELLLPRGGR